MTAPPIPSLEPENWELFCFWDSFYRVGNTFEFLLLPTRTALDGPTHIPQLPVELIRVIMVLQLDKRTLSSCSCVCHTWLHLGRKQLFKNIRIKYDKLHTFLHFLKSDQGYNICDYVCGLTVDSRYLGSGTKTENIAVLLSILALFPCIDGLSMDGPLLWTISDYLSSPSRGDPTIKLDSLMIIGYEGTTRDFVDFLNLFTDIKTFYIEDVDWTPEFGSLLRQEDADSLCQRYNIPSQLQLGTLSIGMAPGCSETFILEVIRRTCSVRTLKTLDVECTHMNALASLFGLLTDAGSCVTDLIMRVSEDDDYNGWESVYPKLASCASVHSLKLNLFLGPEYGYDSDEDEEVFMPSCWLHAATLLQHLPPTIVHLELYLFDQTPGTMESQLRSSPQSPNLDATLSTSLPLLKAVSIGCHNHISEELKSSFVDSLPLTYRRGLLQFLSEDRAHPSGARRTT